VGDGLGRYLQEIAEHDLLSEAEETALATRIAAGRQAQHDLAAARGALDDNRRIELEGRVADGARARTRLIECNLRLVVWAVQRYAVLGESKLDLIQEGNLGLQAAAERYDGRAGSRFPTYAMWWIRRAIVQALSEHSRGIRLPAHVRRIVQSAARIEQALSHELEREPTLAEVAARLGIHPRQLIAIRSMAAPLTSLDALGDTSAGADDECAEGAVGRQSDGASNNGEVDIDVATALASLKPREQQILTLRYGLDQQGERTRAEVGEALGLSPEWVRQIENQALGRLRHNGALTRAWLS